MSIIMPETGSYDDVCTILKRKKQTVYIWASRGEFPKGVYLGRGIFNLSRLLECMQNGILLKPQKRFCPKSVVPA